VRTTLKRGLGRSAAENGNAFSVSPAAIRAVTHYQQPPPARRSGFRLVCDIFLGTLIVLSAVVLGVIGGAYLYFNRSVAAVQAHSPAVIKAAKSLDVVPAHAPAIALIVGYDQRQGAEYSSVSRSDTVMLVRADPINKTISMLSFPRDLEVPIYCGPTTSGVDRINSAYARCNVKGTLLTVRHLTGLPINYLITVNFHGFKEVVDKLGGVWMDIDRRYYNKNTGAAYDNYANIDLQPGYQLLNGEQALDFVRFRHTDDDLHRNARQQQFVRAIREQIRQNFSPLKIPGIVNAMTNNVEVAAGGRKLSGGDVLRYALFAYDLPPGHVFQDRIENVQCNNTCTASSTDVQNAVQEFTNPDVGTSKSANAAALGEKPKQTAPPPSRVTITVLNGNGVAGDAANASYLLAQGGYQTLIPPGGLAANWSRHLFHTKIYYDPAQKGSQAASKALQKLMQPADVARLPRTNQMLALDPGSMLIVIVGETFDDTIAPAPVQTVPAHQPAYVTYDAAPSAQLLRPLRPKVGFPLYVPTVLERDSVPDTQPGDTPVRLYWIDGRKNKAVRLVFRTGANEYWGVEESDWTSAPVLSDRSFRHDLGGREFNLYYNGPHLHMVVLNAHGATYWVVNTLLDSLSNETMLAIANGLKPLNAIHS
jgi:LCP family protein required for cell wall assembly